ncbi:Spermidine N(1)-acetyltransferase [bioreactor metagenome]|uniref:Spermidine N(1)-acetyltransferase n=1 Tax=bioreactor metagenome TaxID=1076179 RepID=A0A645C2B9_9ZZZZ
MNVFLQTSRLALSAMTEQDADFIRTLYDDVRLFTYESEIPTRDRVEKQFFFYLEEAKKLPSDGAIRFIIRHQSQAIGQVQLTCNWPAVGEWELGYSLQPTYWRQGYGKEAVAAILIYAFEELHIHKLMAFINAENVGSVSLAQSVGMVQEGHMREARWIRGTFQDEKVFAMLEADYQKAKEQLKRLIHEHPRNA